MEQLGPFHFFFTLSAAEMRWPEVTTSILHYEGMIDKIVYRQGWEFDENNIDIYFMGWETDDSKTQSLKEFKETQKDKHKFYKDHFFLITRLFDNRVKARIDFRTKQEGFWLLHAKTGYNFSLLTAGQKCFNCDFGRANLQCLAIKLEFLAV